MATWRLRYFFFFGVAKKNRDASINVTAAADPVDNIRPHLYAATFITTASYCTYRAKDFHACITCGKVRRVRRGAEGAVPNVHKIKNLVLKNKQHT